VNCGHGRDASRQIILGFGPEGILKRQNSIFSKNGDDSVGFLLKAHHLHSFLQVLILKMILGHMSMSLPLSDLAAILNSGSVYFGDRLSFIVWSDVSCDDTVVLSGQSDYY
jgi:hypothetical protein